MAVLHHEIIGSEGNPAFIFIHGILGTGANLRTLAKQLVEARPQFQAVLVDLRAHGKSAEVAGPDTVEQAARDVIDTLPGLTISGVLGHSFGGKVAMALSTIVNTIDQFIILDSVPGTRLDARGSELTVQVIQLLENAHGPWASRNDFVREMQTRGLSQGVAMWLAMNLKHTGTEFVRGVDLSRIRALLTSYLAWDAWPLLEETAIRHGPAKWHFVNGANSSVFTDEDKARLAALAARSEGSITVAELPTGHWVHAEDPEGTKRLMLEYVKQG